MRAFALALLLLPLVAAAADPLPDAGAAQKPMEFDEYYFVMLMRPKDPPKFTDEELRKLQKGHLAHFEELAKAGKLVVAGPFMEQPDPRFRGLCIYRVKTKDEATRLAEADPMVKAGRLEVMVMKWMTEKGALAFPMAEAMAR